MPQIVQLDPRNPDPQTLRRAVVCLQEGHVLVFPTETFYALGVSAYHEQAIRKVFAIKGRNYDKPIPLIIQGESMLEEVAAQIPECARTLIHTFWPGALTLIFKASAKIPSLLTAFTGTVAVRDSSHSLAQLLVQDARLPITATSANISGDASCFSAEEVEHQLGDRVDLIIDGGPTPGGLPSTIVDFTPVLPRIVREGAVSSELLRPYLS